jgi:hypothetical protein
MARCLAFKVRSASVASSCSDIFLFLLFSNLNLAVDALLHGTRERLGPSWFVPPTLPRWAGAI